MNEIEHRGIKGRVTYEREDAWYYADAIDCRDTIVGGGITHWKAEQSFRKAVDEYLATLEEA
jgi:hypothetical protein